MRLKHKLLRAIWLVLPIYDYTHLEGGCSVTGGVAYRGSVTELDGHYLFADFCSNRIWSFVWDGATGFSDFAERTTEFEPEVGAITSIVAFAEDGFGEVYIIERGFFANTGELFKLVPVLAPIPTSPPTGLWLFTLALLGSAALLLRRT